jgi:signal transduction histidine kinase/CheY-like chemotaxis protein
VSRLDVGLLWRQTPSLALAAAILLLLAGLAGAFFSEQDFRHQKIEQAQAHARVLAASVSAALAFQDHAEAANAISALSANPDADAIGVYSADGALFAQRVGPSSRVPERLNSWEIGAYRDGHAVASAPVLQNDTLLGGVYVRLSAGSGAARWMRYIGVALLTIMGAVMAAVIASTQRVLSNANAELSRRADELAQSNAQLSAEMAERKRAQEALAQAQKMEAIGQLTGGVAHDFNNLLMVISSGLRLLETRDDENKRASIVAAMRQAVDRGAGLTKQLLAFSRRQKLSPEPMLVHERIEGLRSLIERSIREDIALEFDFADADAVVKADPGHFDLAILNLAVNARDAMPKGGRLSIGVAALPAEPDMVAVTVTDTGVGMTPEVRARAFDPFFTTKEVGRGTGLGLSQVYGFALQSGGRCEIESEPGCGATIRLLLPRSAEPVVRPTEPEADKAAEAGAGAVLVVEDDDHVAAMVCEMIRDLGYEATRVPNAADALAELDNGKRVDLLFSDIIMPGGMNGIELAKEARRRRADLPILLTTGYGGRGEVDVQGFRVLRKPYDRDELGAALAGAR